VTLAFAKIQYERSVNSLKTAASPTRVLGDSMSRTMVSAGGIWVQPDRGWQIEGDTITVPASSEPWIFQPISTIRWIIPTGATAPPPLPGHRANYHLIGPSRWLEPGRAGDALAIYRSSAAGGGFRVQTWPQEELAFWFGYGYEHHPIAYRHWSRWLFKRGQADGMVALLGKTLTYPNRQELKDKYPGPPTFGHPGSDYLLLQMTDTPTSPSIGRIAARTEEELRAYLEKVQHYEALFREAATTDRHYWRKRVLHISGGRGSERRRFAALLDQLERTLSQNGYGAEVINTSKESDQPVDVSVAQKAIDAINEGVGIKTFLGHGAVVNTDIGLDDPSLFEATDKTGLFFSLGCSTGNLFTVQESISERFVLAPDRGALAYIASAGVGSDYDQFTYTRLFYEALGSTCFTCPLGIIMRGVRQQFENDTSRIRQILTQQMTFHGDPALRLQVNDTPDYALDAATARMSTDQLTVTLNIKNLGRNRPDTIPVQLRVVSPSGKNITYDTLVVVSGHLNLDWAIPYPDQPVSGALTLYAILDPDQRLEEVTHENNALLHPIQVEVRSSGPAALFPPDDWVVTDTIPELWASVDDPFAARVHYQFEVDTVPDFSSPFRKKWTVSGGSAVGWKLEHVPEAASVLFWRVYSPHNSPDEQPVHRFTYRPANPGGWQQAHPLAFRQNTKHGLVTDSTGWNLASRPVGILAMSVSQAPVSSDRSRLFLDNDSVDKVPHGQASLTCYVFDKKSPDVWTSKTYSVLSSDSRQALVNDLRAYPAGTPILLIGYVRKGYSYTVHSWSGLRSYLEHQGATQLERLTIAGSAPYAFAFRKDEGVLGEIPVPDTPATRANLLFDLLFPVQKGTMVSPRIGPAKAWRSLFLSMADSLCNYQQLNLSVLAKAASGDTLNHGTWPIPNCSTTIDLSDIDAQRWPYLLLQYEAKGSLLPIASWTVDYDPATELALADLSLPDTIWPGQPVSLTGKVLAFPPDRRAIPVRLSLQTLTPGLRITDTLEAPATFSLPLATNHLPGKWPLQVRVSPLRPEYPEWISRNNRAEKTVTVRQDSEEPTLLLSLDGRTPVPDQQVGSEPLIRIHMMDRNPYGLISDTVLISIQLVFPDGTKRPIPLNHPFVDLTPVNHPGDTLAITLKLQLAQRGQYTLLITGRDRSGNAVRSGLSFLVGEGRPPLSLRPFPNPFSSRIRFAYTYRGLVKVTTVRMAIVNKAGQVVRQVTAEEFGPLFPGEHLSDWVWDGKDEAGKVVPDGIYGYRLEWAPDPVFGTARSLERVSGILVKMH
jgi:hypothetical protein